MRERDYAGWESLNQRFFRRSDPDAGQPRFVSIIAAAGRGDSATLERLLRDEEKTPDANGYLPRELLRALGATDVAERIARRYAAPDHPRDIRADAHMVLAESALGQGRWTVALAQLDSLAVFDDLRARLLRGAFATMPFAPWPRRDLDAIERELVEWDPRSELGAHATGPTLALFPHIRLYLLGLLRSRLRDERAAAAYADSLDSLPTAAWLLPVREALARIVRADIAARRGDAVRVLELLEPVRGEVPIDVVPGGNVPRLGDHVLSQEHARFLRAEALTEVGRLDEASRWLENSFVLAPGEFIYRAPVALRLARIHDRAGRSERARARFGEVIELWSEAEGELRTDVEHARRRVAELDGG